MLFFFHFFVRESRKITHFSGVTHADDLIYLFKFPFPSVPPGKHNYLDDYYY